MRRLHQVTRKLGAAPDLTRLLPQVLDGAMALSGADCGNVHVFDPVTGGLTIAAQSGFSAEFLEYFTVVDDDHAACGRAARTGAQPVIIDVDRNLELEVVRRQIVQAAVTQVDARYETLGATGRKESAWRRSGSRSSTSRGASWSPRTNKLRSGER
jgi:hypothetical protein